MQLHISKMSISINFCCFLTNQIKITVFLQLVNFISFLILILNEAVCSSPKASKMKFTELFIWGLKYRYSKYNRQKNNIIKAQDSPFNKFLLWKNDDSFDVPARLLRYDKLHFCFCWKNDDAYEILSFKEFCLFWSSYKIVTLIILEIIRWKKDAGYGFTAWLSL